MPEKIIMGIDPGSHKTGFGIIKINSQGLVFHVTHGVLMLDKKLVLSDRLRDLALDLNILLKKYQPSLAVIEDIFLYKNPRSALILGQARGAVLGILGLHNIPSKTLAPTYIKSMITGRGSAQKFQVAQMVALELKIPVPSSPDAADALAMALAQARAPQKVLDIAV